MSAVPLRSSGGGLSATRPHSLTAPARVAGTLNLGRTCQVIKSPRLRWLWRPGPCPTHTEGRCSGCRRERHKSLWPWATSSWKTLQRAGSEVSVLARLPHSLPRITGQTAEAQCQLFAPGVLGALCSLALPRFIRSTVSRVSDACSTWRP